MTQTSVSVRTGLSNENVHRQEQWCRSGTSVTKFMPGSETTCENFCAVADTLPLTDTDWIQGHQDTIMNIYKLFWEEGSGGHETN